MTDSDQQPEGPRARVPAAVWALAAVGLLWGGFELVSWGIRVYVDARIERSVGAPIVDFDLEDLEGRRWRAQDLRGRSVVLHFFRSKCPSCIAERDSIRALEQRLDPERAVLLGVLLDRVQGYAPETTAATLARLDYRHPILVADAAFVDAFHGAGWAHVTPVTYVVGPDGRIAGSVRGAREAARIAELLPDDALTAGTDGDPPGRDAPNGDAPNGDAPNGGARDGGAPDGGPPDGDAPQREPEQKR